MSAAHGDTDIDAQRALTTLTSMFTRTLRHLAKVCVFCIFTYNHQRKTIGLVTVLMNSVVGDRYAGEAHPQIHL
jgi:hypothetical protein